MRTFTLDDLRLIETHLDEAAADGLSLEQTLRRTSNRIADLRVAELFLNDFVTEGVTPDRVQRELSARIAGHELHHMCPELSNEQVCKIAIQFLERKENVR
jgi:hypothetical protein